MIASFFVSKHDNVVGTMAYAKQDCSKKGNGRIIA